MNEIGNGQELELEDQRNQTTSQGSASSDQQGQENTIGLEGFDADDELRKIAEDGRDWKLRHLRQEDMEVYLFRLLIEWARILNPDSPSPQHPSPPAPAPSPSLTTTASTTPSST